jgi:hypothetical protein
MLEDGPCRFQIMTHDQCWTHAHTIEELGYRRFGCYECGRFHECFASSDHCPMVPSDNGTGYHCGFSGAELVASDLVLGGFKEERAAATAPTLSNWHHGIAKRVHKTAKEHFASAGAMAHNAALKRKELKRGDAVIELQRTQAAIGHYTRKSRPKAASSTKRERRLDRVLNALRNKQHIPAPDNDPMVVEEETTVAEDPLERRMREWQPGPMAHDDNSDNEGTWPAEVASMVGNDNVPLYAAVDLERDTSFHGEYFHPLADNIRTSVRVLQQLLAPPPPPLLPAPSQQQQQQQQQPFRLPIPSIEARWCIQRGVRLIIERIHQTSRVGGDAPSWEYYASVCTNLLTLVQPALVVDHKPSNVYNILLVLLVQILTQSLVCQDVVLWVGDPWLRQHAANISEFAVSKQKGKKGGGGGGGGAVDKDDAARSSLQVQWNRVKSHLNREANSFIQDLLAVPLSPWAKFTLLHTTLVARTGMQANGFLL